MGLSGSSSSSVSELDVPIKQEGRKEERKERRKEKGKEEKEASKI